MISNVLAFAQTENIVFTVLSVVAALIVIVYLIFRTRRDRMVTGSKLPEKGVMSAESFKKFLSDTCNTASKHTRFTLYLVDIRRYDTLVKAIGDEQYATVVKEVCQTLQKFQPWGVYLGMKKQDSVYMLLKGDQSSAENVCELIVKTVAKNYELSQGMNVDILVNVAAAAYPEAGTAADALLDSLDVTMVVSRRKGENKYALYAPQYANARTEEFQYYQEIREAIKEKEFTLFYQPVVDTDNMEVFSCEALIRWMHRTKGVLSPSSFLYVMEQTGDINWVGQWCFEQLVKQSVIWDSNYEQKFSISFNLSERQLLNPELAEEFKRIAHRFKGKRTNIVLEIGDMTIYLSSEIAKKNLDALHLAGFQICLDGFGTSFNSPTSLEDLPIDIIKIEKSFWNKAAESTVVANTINVITAYAKEKNVQLVASGVEDAEEIQALRKLGIKYMQGYAFSKPKDAKDFIGDVVFTPWQDEIKAALAVDTALPALPYVEEEEEHAESISESSEISEATAPESSVSDGAEEESPATAEEKKPAEKKPAAKKKQA